MTPYDRAERAAEWLAQRGEFSAAVVLGSGWSNASALGDVRDEWAFADIPGAQVVGISLVTNAAAGLSSTALDHTEVLDVGRASSTQLVDVVRTAVSVS